MINVVVAFALGLFVGGMGMMILMAMLQIAGDPASPGDEQNARSTD